MKMAGFYDESISNGLGWRAVLFVSGCPHHCPGCHNEIAQDYNYGEEFKENEIIELIEKNYVTGPCAKLISRMLISDKRLDPDMNFGEDMVFILSVLNFSAVLKYFFRQMELCG